MFCAIYLILLLFVKILAFLFLVFALLLVVMKIIEGPSKCYCRCSTKLYGKIVLVTGGNSGIGLETARDLARRGARVIIASRNTVKSAQAVADIIETTGNTQVEHRYLNLIKFSSIKEFAEDFNQTVPRLDILVNNAGCSLIKSKVTEDGLQSMLQINYFGGVLLTNLLLDKLVASKPSRIVVVSSTAQFRCTFDPEDLTGEQAHKNRLSFWEIYGRSKLYQVMWTKALAKRLPIGVTVNALCPGLVKTRIYSKIPLFYKKVVDTIMDLLFRTPVQGAQTVIHLCVAPELEKVSGEVYQNCKPCQVAEVVNDENVIERLWNETLVSVTQSSSR